MLKALELIGFKSFADKTRFEFPAGITVVVGPNGSGKSNIVDAIKWVLGEQSVKSLRGKEMSDVIFKGGGAGGRKMLNMAEATLVIDNANKHLLYDAEEIRVTRRVYRGGDGEYLINGQPCRLKDIKQLFRGSGVGADSYSIIEQGKLDVLLQASPRDRRAIFEEAAGISRFKAKKIEAQRRLERVDQNMLRLTDIVEEVENRLKTVRSQATKAQRYKEHRDRLQELRTQVGLTDWRQLTEHVDSFTEKKKEVDALLAARQEDAEQGEQRLHAIEALVEAAVEKRRRLEQQVARHRERIAACTSTVEHSRSRAYELDAEVVRQRSRFLDAISRTAGLQQRLAEIVAEVETAERAADKVRDEVERHDRSVENLTSAFEQVRQTHEEQRRRHLKQTRTAAELAGQVNAEEIKRVDAQDAVTLCQTQQDRLRRETSDLQTRLHAARRTENDRDTDVVAAEAALQAGRERLSERQCESRALDEKLSLLREKHHRARARAAVLRELEEQLDGISSGVQTFLSETAKRSQNSTVRGVVADLLRAPFESAALIDVALGDKAQGVVIAGATVEKFAAQLDQEIRGRVRFISLLGEAVSPPLQLEGRDGVVARADHLVEAELPYYHLAVRLLADAWIVDTLATAFALARETHGAARFVTLAGELLERDGTLVVGSKEAASGLISRRSELRELAGRLESLELSLEELEQETTELADASGAGREEVRRCEETLAERKGELVEARLRTAAIEEQVKQLFAQQETLGGRLETAIAKVVECTSRLEEANVQLAATRQSLRQHEAELEQQNARLEELDEKRTEHAQQGVRLKVELVRSEQILASLLQQQRQTTHDLSEREVAAHETLEQLAGCEARRRQLDLEVLAASAELAELFLNNESLDHESGEIGRAADDAVSQREQVNSQLRQLREQRRKLDDQRLQFELEVNQARQQRVAMSERLKEDYGIDLETLREQEGSAGEQRLEVEQEIADLRNRLNRIGAVNMEALAELEELDARFSLLSSQHQDLLDAKESLEKIIARINGDSRRLFAETLETVRGNFQVLFRKVFGGGNADIVLEEGVDILESGVDIIATPPGKQALSISLLSGGERALAAVTLLLAIFQFRPSPFCVLDEVDGPLDEANIGRFVDQLREFLGWTKFIIVTHSKKTMTAANTLHGVTMQESGVSKRVSVKFEDVTEEGEILSATANQGGSPDESDAA